MNAARNVYSIRYLDENVIEASKTAVFEHNLNKNYIIDVFGRWYNLGFYVSLSIRL